MTILYEILIILNENFVVVFFFDRSFVFVRSDGNVENSARLRKVPIGFTIPTVRDLVRKNNTVPVKKPAPCIVIIFSRIFSNEIGLSSQFTEVPKSKGFPYSVLMWFCIENLPARKHYEIAKCQKMTFWVWPSLPPRDLENDYFCITTVQHCTMQLQLDIGLHAFHLLIIGVVVGFFFFNKDHLSFYIAIHV